MNDQRRNGLVGRLRRALYGLGNEPASRAHHLWRDLMPLLALVLATFAVFGVENKVDQATVDARVAKAKAASQADGRRIAIAVLCGFGNGVEQAGKASIATPVQPPRFRRALEKLGLPAKRTRAKAARAAGEAYARSISESVVEQAGVDARTVIKPDGSLSCEALQGVAKTAPRP